MISLKTKLLETILNPRVKKTYRRHQDAFGVQQKVLTAILCRGQKTLFGKQHDLPSHSTHKEFSQKIPVHTYKDLSSYIDSMRKDEENILWPGHVEFFSKSSGTTNNRSKYIPVSCEALHENHLNAGRDTIAFYLHNFPGRGCVDGGNVGIRGSIKTEGFHLVGDISSIISTNMPWWAKRNQKPDQKIALLPSWKEKLSPMAEALLGEDIRVLAGVPSWLLHLCREVLSQSNKKSLHEVWPNLEHVWHGGVSMSPYKEQFLEICDENKVVFQEVYNASEGFFAAQDTFYKDKQNGMILFLNHGIFYEFAPMQNSEPDYLNCITIKDVKQNTPYALVITTNAGLWRYAIGDVVSFININPYRIIITGRTKSYINLCGEELMVHNTNEAFVAICKKHNVTAAEYTAAPFAAKSKKEQSKHQWIIASSAKPKNLQAFTKDLDDKLREVNSDYDAKRTGSIALQELLIYWAPQDIFKKWMESKNKTSVQTKVPRLSNNTVVFDEVKALMK